MSSVVVDRGIVGSPELGEVVASDTIMSRFSPLNPQQSPVPVSVAQVVVESPTSNKAPVGAMDVWPAADQVVTLLPQESQVSQLSSVQLSPNRVREVFDIDTMDVFLVLLVSPRSDGYFPSVSSVSSPGSPAAPAPGSVLNEVTGSFVSTVGSPVTSLSITDYAADLTLLWNELLILVKRGGI